MKKTAMFLTAVATAAIFGSAAQAADGGTAAEARTLLIRAVNEVRINQAKAIDKFNKGENGFVDRDLYVFCFNGGDGKNVSNVDKRIIGQDVRSFRDSTGYAFGEALYRDNRQGVIKTFSYLWPRPGDTKPVPKESYATRVGGLVCGVGYYK